MTSIALNDLHSKGYVQRMEISNSHIYSLTDSPLIDQIKKTLGLSLIMESDLISKMKERYPDIISIALHGSFSRGDYDNLSDIDIVVISSDKRSFDMRLVEPVEGFEVNIETFTPGSWNKIKKESPAFYSRVMKDHIILYGIGLI
jgi:uncharacterized protein